MKISHLAKLTRMLVLGLVIGQLMIANGRAQPTYYSALQPDVDQADRNKFGFSVAINDAGDIAVVGMFKDYDPTRPPGKAYVYEFNSEHSMWVLTQTLAPTSQLGAAFGFSVDISGSGDRVVVGAKLYDQNSVDRNSGQVWVYRWDDGEYVIEDTLEPVVETGGGLGWLYDARFGFHVDISDDETTIGVTAPNQWHHSPNDISKRNRKRGEAYVFTRSGTSWNRIPPVKLFQDTWKDQDDYSSVEEEDEEPPDEKWTTPYLFGHSIQIVKNVADSGEDWLVVGAPHHDRGDPDPTSDPADYDEGALHMFKLEDATWTHKQTIEPPHPRQETPGVPREGYFFGRHTRMDDNLLVTQPNRTTDTPVYRYHSDTDTWDHEATLITDFMFYHSINLDTRRVGTDEYIYLGASEWDYDNATMDVGKIWVFKYDDSTSTLWSEDTTYLPDDNPLTSEMDFGGAVAVAENNGTIVTGAPRFDNVYTSQGKVYWIYP